MTKYTQKYLEKFDFIKTIIVLLYAFFHAIRGMYLEVLRCTILVDIFIIKCSREIPAKNCKVFCSIYRRFNIR